MSTSSSPRAVTKSNQVLGGWKALPVGDDGVVDGVPVTAQIHGHLVHAPGVTTDLGGGAPGGSGGEHLSRSGDPVVLLGPRTHRAVGIGARPPALVPHQAGGTTEERQIDQLHPGAILHPGDRPTVRTAKAGGLGLHVDPGLAVGTVFTAEEGDHRKSDHPLHARVGSVSTGVLHLRSLNNQRLVDPRYIARGSDYWTPLISEAPRIRGVD